MWQIWLIISSVCFIIEMMTVGFFVFWFGIGAILAMVTSFIIPDNIIIQSIVFLVSSTLLVFFTKPFAEKFVFSKKDNISTNAFSIIGKNGLVIQDINNTLGIGQIKISGEIWSAKTLDGSTIEKGTQIEVIQIDGVKAVVEACQIKSELIEK